MRMTRTSRYRWLPVRIDDFEKWQLGLLEESAQRLGAVLDPDGHVYRWGFVGSPVMFRGQRAWLRVSPFLEHEMSGKAWRGTAEAATIPGVSKPALLHRIEWRTDGPQPVPVSAEVLTLVTDPPASRERFLRTAPRLPVAWFSDLEAAWLQVRAGDQLEPVAGRVFEVDAPAAVLGVGLAGAAHLRVGPVLDPQVAQPPASTVEQVVVDQEGVVVHLDFHARLSELEQHAVVELDVW
jgi:hypothetical protein